jgi:hypothetical protein
MMKKFLIILLIVLFVSNTAVFAEEGQEEIKYIIFMTNDFEDGTNFVFQMQTEKQYSTGGYTIELRHKDYGNFYTFGPYVESPSTPIVTMGFAPARGDFSLKKKDRYHFIFFPGRVPEKIKEEFLITVENGVIRVKPLSKTKYITFEKQEIRVFPENTLTVMMRFDSLSIDKELKEKLKENGCKPMILPVGDYGLYKVLGYSETDKYAHKTSQFENSFYYYYEIKNNYEKIENILKENKLPKESRIARYSHSYNFDIEKRIEYEKNPVRITEMTEVQIPPYMQSQRLDDIIFHLDKPASVTVKITNIKGDKIEEIKMDIESAGTVNYKWDGILKDGTKATSGIYTYQVLLEEKTLRIGFFSLK